MKIILSVFLTIVVIALIFLLFISSGWYNVSAMNKESGIMKWIFTTTKENSVETRSANISVPDLSNLDLVEEGFEHYNEMCVDCHGAPGFETTELAKGLNPPAPDLVESVKEMKPTKLFWVTRNGIRMTGMPAWGKTHSDEKIWAIVAFMKKLPEMSAEEYKEMQDESSMVDKTVRSPYTNRHDDNEQNHEENSKGEDHHHHDH